jgi:hypothetical protein
MTPPTRPALGIALLLFAQFAVAQSKLGELLDVGAKKLSADEFRQELVQRVLVGPTPTGGNLEMMYAANGSVEGWGAANPTATYTAAGVGLRGEWTLDGAGRTCTSLRIGGVGSYPGGTSTPLPPRCQFWFKYKEQYFLSDSDTDRSARVLSRTIKQ